MFIHSAHVIIRIAYCVRGEDSVLVIDIDRATPEIFYRRCFAYHSRRRKVNYEI